MPRGKMTATERAIIEVMTEPSDQLTDARRGIIGYRTRRIWHGPMMDVLVYPVYSRGYMPEVRGILKAHKPTREIQVKLNHRRSQETLIRRANHNFGDGDWLITITFAMPEGEEAVKREISNWERRMRNYWRRHGRELKFLCTLEKTESILNGVRYHLHAIVNASRFDRGEVERLWKKGYCNTREHQHNEQQMAGFAAYLDKYKPTQQKVGRKHWWGSRNLVRPPESYSDHRATPAKMERIARGLEMDGRMWVEKLFPQFRCIEDVRCRRNDFLPGCYFFARMRRRD